MVRFVVVLSLLTALAPQESDAENLKVFTVTWSGAEFQNSATATATVTLDMDNVANPGTSGGTRFVDALSMTVQNAATGNGTWSKTDYGFFRLTTGHDSWISPVS